MLDAFKLSPLAMATSSLFYVLFKTLVYNFVQNLKLGRFFPVYKEPPRKALTEKVGGESYG